MKNCAGCLVSFEMTQDDRDFYENISPVFNEQKYLIPEPTLCPECRQQRRLSWRNERSLYKDKCDLCDREILSMYSPDKERSVHCIECSTSDKWDPLFYGRDFDFDRPFFDQFKELLDVVPRQSLDAGPNRENSEFVNCANNLKNCYLAFETGECEHCMYSRVLAGCDHVLEVESVVECNWCYEIIGSSYSGNLFFSSRGNNCSDSYFLMDCIGCHHCFGGINLRNSSYMFFGEQLSKENWKQRVEELNLGNYENLQYWKSKFREYLLTQPHRPYFIRKSENSTGDILEECKNVKMSFDTSMSWDCKYMYDVIKMNDAYDVISWGGKSERLYECQSVGDRAYEVMFSNRIADGVSRILYCDDCSSSNDLFGCTGMDRNKFCILNKQYTEEEYNQLVPRIIEHMRGTGEWGEFFPGWLSFFGYNETPAQEYYPLEKDDARAQGFKWSDYEAPLPQAEKVIPADKISVLNDIKDVPDEVTKWAIECERSGRLFQIQKAELDFYRTMGLPIPHLHPEERHRDRVEIRNPRRLWHRVCDREGCNIEFDSTYNPERSEIVYCEKCYEEIVY